MRWDCRIEWIGVLALTLLLGASPVRAGDSVYELTDHTEVSLGATTVGLFGLGYWSNQSYQPLTAAEIAALDPADLNALDRTAVDNWSPRTALASDYLVTASIVAPVTLMFSESGRDQAGVIGVMYAETFLLNSGLTYLMKNIFNRTRPFVYNQNSDIPQHLKMSHTARRSFPSGHTSTAFASLVFLASVHTQMYPDSSANDWVWGGCLAAAATAGYLRYASGWHYPTDILAGATIGAFAGWLVPHLHEWDESPGDSLEKSRPGRESLLAFTLAF